MMQIYFNQTTDQERKLKKRGVTLLEIMLVLAIAAMIIVMSVRYYQSATAAQRANACLAYLQAVVAAADSLAEGTLSYSKITSSAIDQIVPRNNAICSHPTEGTIESSTDDSLTINIQLPEKACRLMVPALIASGHWGWTSTTALQPNNCSGISQGNAIHYSRQTY